MNFVVTLCAWAFPRSKSCALQKKNWQEKLRVGPPAFCWLRRFFSLKAVQLKAERPTWITQEARIQDFGQGGPAEFWPQWGALSLKCAQNGGFSLKIAWKLHDFEEILWARGAQGPCPPDPLLQAPSVLFSLCKDLPLPKRFRAPGKQTPRSMNSHRAWPRRLCVPLFFSALL